MVTTEKMLVTLLTASFAQQASTQEVQGISIASNVAPVSTLHKIGRSARTALFIQILHRWDIRKRIASAILDLQAQMVVYAFHVPLANTRVNEVLPIANHVTRTRLRRFRANHQTSAHKVHHHHHPLYLSLWSLRARR